MIRSTHWLLVATPLSAVPSSVLGQLADESMDVDAHARFEDSVEVRP